LDVLESDEGRVADDDSKFFRCGRCRALVRVCRRCDAGRR
jgi:hypothetical protein